MSCTSTDDDEATTASPSKQTTKWHKKKFKFRDGLHIPAKNFKEILKIKFDHHDILNNFCKIKFNSEECPSHHTLHYYNGFFCCKMYNTNNMQTLGFALYCNSFLPTVRFTIALLLALRYRQCQILKALAWMYQNSTSIRNFYCCFDDVYSIFFLSGSPTTFKRAVDFDTYIISMLTVLLFFLYCSVLWFYRYF